MTTIGSMPSFPATPRRTDFNGAAAPVGFADHYDLIAARTSEEQSDRLNELTAELDALEGWQLSMSISDYLFASFSLKEQIAAERINLGENIDTMGVNFEGRVFAIGLKRLNVDLLEAVRLPETMMAKLAEPRGYSEP